MKESTRKLFSITLRSHDVLFQANSVFPFLLFPDTITIDREKVTIVHRSFFRVAKIISVQLKDILSAEVDVGPLFGSLQVVSRYFVNNPQVMKYLKRDEAIKAQRILHGYIIAHQKEVDTGDIPKDQLLTLLDDLGQGVSD